MAFNSASSLGSDGIKSLGRQFTTLHLNSSFGVNLIFFILSIPISNWSPAVISKVFYSGLVLSKIAFLAYPSNDALVRFFGR